MEATAEMATAEMATAVEATAEMAAAEMAAAEATVEMETAAEMGEGQARMANKPGSFQGSQIRPCFWALRGLCLSP